MKKIIFNLTDFGEHGIIEIINPPQNVKDYIKETAPPPLCNITEKLIFFSVNKKTMEVKMIVEESVLQKSKDFFGDI